MQSYCMLKGLHTALANLPRLASQQTLLMGYEGRALFHTTQKVGDGDAKFGQWLLSFRKAQQNYSSEFMANLSPEMEEKREKIVDIIDITPGLNKDKISSIDMMNLLTLNSVKSIQRKLSQLRSKQMKKISEKEMKKQQQAEKEAQSKKESSNNDLLLHREMKPSRLPYVHLNSVFERARTWSDICNIVHGHPIILDMGYDLSFSDTEKLFQEIVAGIRHRKLNSASLHMYATGLQNNDFLMYLYNTKAIDNMVIDFYPQDFWDMFPRKDLVYLTPDGPMLRNYNPSDIYVVGFLGDECKWNELSISKARELGIRHGSFPIYSYYQRQNDFHKTLGLATALGVVMEASRTNSWKDGLFNVVSDSYARIEETDDALAQRWNTKSKKKFRNLFR